MHKCSFCGESYPDHELSGPSCMIRKVADTWPLSSTYTYSVPQWVHSDSQLRAALLARALFLIRQIES
jgi:hypothetical protein